MKLCQKIIEYYKYRKNNEQEKEMKTTERHTKPATNSLLAIGGKRWVGRCGRDKQGKKTEREREKKLIFSSYV